MMYLSRSFRRILAVAFATIWLAGPALAQQTPTGLSYKSTAIALSSSASCPTATAANPFIKALFLDNTGGAIDVGYCFIEAGQSSCTPVIGTPPTTTLPAGTYQWWTGGTAPQNGICFIAASGTPSITVREGQ